MKAKCHRPMDLKAENSSMKRNTGLWGHARDAEIQRGDIFLQKYPWMVSIHLYTKKYGEL